MADDGPGPSGLAGEVEADDLYHVMPADQLGDGERVSVDVRGREVTVFNVDGDLVAMLNYCPHQGGPLCEGPVTDRVVATDSFDLAVDPDRKVVRCPWHGWSFDPRTGELLVGDEIETKYRVPSYEVHRRDGELFLRIR